MPIAIRNKDIVRDEYDASMQEHTAHVARQTPQDNRFNQLQARNVWEVAVGLVEDTGYAKMHAAPVTQPKEPDNRFNARQARNIWLASLG